MKNEKSKNEQNGLKVKDYNKLSLKETISRMKQENSDFDSSSDDDEEINLEAGHVEDEDGSSTVGFAIKSSQNIFELLEIFD